MFDSTNIDVRGGNSSASSKSKATASISAPIAVKPANELTRFIRVQNDSPEAKTLFSPLEMPHLICSFGTCKSKGYDLTYEYAKKVQVKIHQIVCYGDAMLVEISEVGDPVWVSRYLSKFSKPDDWTTERPVPLEILKLAKENEKDKQWISTI